MIRLCISSSYGKETDLCTMDCPMCNQRNLEEPLGLYGAAEIVRRGASAGKYQRVSPNVFLLVPQANL
jgi:hypothetical protein